MQYKPLVYIYVRLAENECHQLSTLVKHILASMKNIALEFTENKKDK